jgi:hypothetical protein
MPFGLRPFRRFLVHIMFYIKPSPTNPLPKHVG